MAKLVQAAPISGTRWRSDVLALARLRPYVRSAAVPVAILLLALLLRVYRLELQAWTPDTYEQLDAGRRLAAGQLPTSGFYPPGIAFTLAPAFLVFPQTLATQQGVIIGSALVLIVVVYFAARRATNDRFAPVLLALGVAAVPQMVFLSRDGRFDVTNAAWIVSAILVVPCLRGRSVAVFAAYGCMLAVAMNVRAVNPAFLPALVIYWTDAGRAGIGRRAVSTALICRPVAVASAAMLASLALLAYLGGLVGHAAAHAPITFEYAGRNITTYALAEFGGVLCAPLMLILAPLGGVYLWSRNRSLLFVSIYMLTIFPLAHVPLPFATGRYMLPSLVFALLLAAHAPAAVIGMTARQPALVRNTWRGLTAAVVLLIGANFVVVDAATLWNGPDVASRSDEAGYRQLRPSIAALPSGALLVSGGTRGVRDSNGRIEYLDLIDYSLATDNGPERVNEIMQRIQRALDGGRPVYYLYTSVEGINITFATRGPGYQPYFDAASQRFHLTPVRETSLKFFTLYRVERPR